MKPIISKRGPRILPGRPLNLMGPSNGVFPERHFRTGLESCIAWLDSWVGIHSATISVSIYSIGRSRPCNFILIYCFVGKRCDCKSLHWKFTDRRTCDSTCPSLFDLVICSVQSLFRPGCGHPPTNVSRLSLASGVLR
jgi:hypothetical protein